MSRKNITKVVCAVVGVSGFVGFVAHKLGKNEHAIKEAVDNLAGKTSVEVEKDIIEKAAEKAANDAAEKAINDIEKDINRQIKAGIDKVYADVLKTTGEEFAKRANESINVDKLKNDVESKAATILVKEFKDKMERYSSSLFNTLGSSSGIKITF